jgi:hypothetical protein
MDLMAKVASHSDVNQMSSANLATCIGPNMLRKDLKPDKKADRSSGISPVLLAAAQQSAASRGGGDRAGARKSSLFTSFAPGVSVESLGKPAGSRDTLFSGEKDTKNVLATNAKIVNIVEFMIENFDEIWEVSVGFLLG